MIGNLRKKRQQEGDKMATLDDNTSSISDESWSHWLEKAETNLSKGAISNVKPPPDDRKGDSMKLRQEDMDLYGLCPAQDEFYLVVCEYCGQVIKPQALRRHLEQRHGIHSKVIVAASSHGKDKSSSSSCGSGHSKTHGSSSHKPSKRSSSGSPSAQPAPKDRPLQVPKNKRNPMVKVERIESIKKTSSSNKSASSGSFVTPKPAEPPDKGKPPREREKRELMENDTKEPLAKALKHEPLKHEPLKLPMTTASMTFTSASAPVTTSSSVVSSLQVTTATRTHITHTAVVSTSAMAIPKLVTPKTIVTAIPVTSAAKLAYQASTKANSAVTSTTTSAKPATANSASSASSSSKKPPSKEKKNVLCRDREYDPDKHCGVWVTEDNRPCTRSLTCKTHALSLRRAVKGRIKPFDDLLREHREAKEALLKAKAEASGLPPPPPSLKSKASKSAPCTPIAAGPSPFKLPTTECFVTPPTLLNPPLPAKPVVSLPHKEKLCLNSAFTRQVSLPIFPKAEAVTLAETGYLSSDGEEEDDKDKVDYSVLSHHPRPAAVNTFGGWRHGHTGGCYVFNRKEDLYRAAFFAAVERHLHPPPHKKLCVESNLPKGSTITTNAKDPYEFSVADAASLNVRRNSSSRMSTKSPVKSKAAVGSSPPCGSSKLPDFSSPTHINNSAAVYDLNETFGSPTNSLSATPTPKWKACTSSPVAARSSALVSGGGASHGVLCVTSTSAPIAITIPASLNFNLGSSTLSNINAKLAANKPSKQNAHCSKGAGLNDHVVADSQLNGQLVNLSAPNLKEMTHIQLNRLSEKAKSNRITQKANSSSSKTCNSQSVTGIMQPSKSPSSQGQKGSAVLSRRGSGSNLTSATSLTLPIMASVRSGGLIQLDSTHFSNSFMGTSAITMTTNSSSGSSGSMSSTQPSPIQLSTSPQPDSPGASPMSPLPNGVLSSLHSPSSKFSRSLHYESVPDINLALTNQIFSQHASGSFPLCNSSQRLTTPPQVTLSAAAATAQQLAAAALNLTTQPVSILTTNSTMPQLYTTHVLAKSPSNPLRPPLQLQTKGGLAGGTGVSASKMPLSLTIMGPGGGSALTNSTHPSPHLLLHPADPETHSAVSNIPS